ncbi:isocitrate lyase/phosphoenolpyruvate mutase family protein [Streptomyces verrucosisporus]|uniref:isocitrate lyase/PEP mutase family protein n=1 Tax=Streptomyces verrucosisporus TaxID=1695161 RepID=UPI0019D2C8B3|nr:isocitrate lyase/phosphoenolpyruvate mutase family protein [Streptomyces verrucosisporus]MBN3931105.1 isocitrate lyase/phosphoenolpyruvate mutase family protein [Streptomyces verrucosisporus]
MTDGGRGAVDAFRALQHRDAPLVLPNVWDAVSARAFAGAGFPALATSSSAVAATLGYADGEDTPPGEMFAAVARIVRAVDVPVTADIERGYGLAPEEIAERLLEAGAVGCNLEDSGPADPELADPGRQAERLAAVCAAADGRLLVNARIDTYLRGADDPLAAAVERGRLYAAAGAECVYPITAPPDHLPVLAAEIGVPVNALCHPGAPSPAELGALGAARVTFGGSLHARASAAVADLAAGLRAG